MSLGRRVVANGVVLVILDIAPTTRPAVGPVEAADGLMPALCRMVRYAVEYHLRATLMREWIEWEGE